MLQNENVKTEQPYNTSNPILFRLYASSVTSVRLSTRVTRHTTNYTRPYVLYVTAYFTTMTIDSDRLNTRTVQLINGLQATAPRHTIRKLTPNY